MLKELGFLAAGALVLLGVGYLTYSEEAEKQEKLLLKKKKQEQRIKAGLPPAPPKGYCWKHHESVSFIVPKKWKRDASVVLEQSHNSRKVTYRSPDQRLAFTITWMFNLQSPFQQFLLKVLTTFPEELRKQNKENVAEDWIVVKISDDYTCHYTSYDDTKDPDNPITCRVILISNTRAKIIYFIFFEAPRDTWEDEWNRVGQTIVTSLILESIYDQDEE